MNRSSWKFGACFAALLVTVGVLTGCGGGGGDTPGASGSSGMATKMPKQFNVPPGADPAVSADLGGSGFEKFAKDSGWNDGNVTPELIAALGDKNAKKGGVLVTAVGDFPATFRTMGKDNSTATNQLVSDLVYETLIEVNPLTLEFTPRLASHWKIDPVDSQTYWFRIDPNARFSDGHAVTTEDVLATWKLGLDSSILDPFQNSFEQEFDMPVAVSKYILKIRSKVNNWKNMLYFGQQFIYPAHVVGNIGGKDFLDKFQTDMPPGSGPYVMLKNDLQKQKSFTLTRLEDWWGKDLPTMAGQYNLDKMKFLFVEDENLRYEKFRGGEVDWYHITRAQWWMQKFDFEEVKRGMITKLRVWNDKPQGIQGFAFNMRKPPFDDPRVRQAFVLLFNREEMIEKLMFKQYKISDSYFPNSVYENPSNPKYRYDPQKAAQLLTEAGYTQRNSEGVLMKDGRPFEIDIPINQGDEVILSPVQQSLRKAGIKMNFRLVDFAQKIKLQDERNFNLVFQAYTGILYPNPGNQFDSKLADKPNNHNLTGFKNARADELINLEKVTANQAKRAVILQELDGILMNANNYALSWYAPYERFAIWSYIRTPEFGIGRIQDYRDIHRRWWFDPERKEQVTKAKSDKTVKLDTVPVENHYWEEWKKNRPSIASGATADAGN